MLQAKTIFLILFLLIVLITIVLLQYLKKPTPIIDSQFTPVPYLNQLTSFEIISTNITDQPIGVTDKIKISFSEPVENNSLTLEINPRVDILPLFNEALTELTLEPAQLWNYNTQYSLKIFRKTTSKTKQPLDKDYEFTFKTAPYSGI